MTWGFVAVAIGSAVVGHQQAQKAKGEAFEASERQRIALEQSTARLAEAQKTPLPGIDEARLRAQQADEQRRRRGRKASILTGPEGVGATPIARRTLIGS